MTNYTKGELVCFDEYEVSVDAESNIGNDLAGWHVIGNPDEGNGEMFVVLHFHGTPDREYDGNSDRLMACWNALANIPDPAAFVAAFEGMVEALDYLLKELWDDQHAYATRDEFERRYKDEFAALTAARSALPTPPEPPVFEYKTREKKGKIND